MFISIFFVNILSFVETSYQLNPIIKTEFKLKWKNKRLIKFS